MPGSIESLESKTNSLYSGENLDVKPKNSHNYRKIKSIVSNRKISFVWRRGLNLL